MSKPDGGFRFTHFDDKGNAHYVAPLDLSQSDIDRAGGLDNLCRYLEAEMAKALAATKATTPEALGTTHE